MWKWLVGGAVAAGGYLYLTRIKPGDTVFFLLSSTGAQAQLLTLGLSSPRDLILGMVVQSVANGPANQKTVTGTVTSVRPTPGSPGAAAAPNPVAVSLGPVTVALSDVSKSLPAGVTA